MSTQCPTTLRTLSNWERTLSYSTAPLCPQKQSRPMVTGSSPGTAWSTLPCLSLDTENKSCKHMVNTSSAISLPYRPNSICESSIMTGPAESGLHSDGTSNSQTSLSLRICRSNGSTILPIRVSSPIRNLDKTQIVKEVPPVIDGMRIDAPTRRPTAITYMYAPNIPMHGTLHVVAAPRAKNNLNLQWEHRPRSVHSYVWSDDESPNVTTVSITETIPPVPGPPLDELRNIAKWSVISKQSHLFHITTPVNVDSFCSLLATHPNCPLVESMCKGLRCGFWPWAVTQNSGAPSIVDNAALQKIRNPEHLRFMEKQRDEEISLGHFSSAFTMLMPGMTTVPLWVVQ